MAIGTTVPCSVGADKNGGGVFCASFESAWQIVIDAGGIATADNAGTVTNPTTQCTTSTTHIFQKPQFGGTLIVARVGYDVTLTSITSPIVCLYGRTRTGYTWSNGLRVGGTLTAWERLYNQAATPVTAVTITMAAATDVTVAAGFEYANSPALAYTEVDHKSHVWDCKGCNEFVFGILTALNGSTGTEAPVSSK